MREVFIADIKLKAIVVAIIATTICLSSADAQSDSTRLHKYPEKIITYTHDKVKKAEEAISKHLDQKDSLYISPNKYKVTLMTQYINSYEFYRFTSANKKQSITLLPDNSDKIGIYIGWKWLFLGWAFDLNRQTSKTDWNFSFYTSKIGIDLFYRKRSNGFKIRELKGFRDKNDIEIDDYNRTFDGISVSQRGVNVYYIFNNKHFSYPAAYSQTTNQRISCGTFILGLNYSEQSFDINTEKFDNDIKENMLPDFKFNKVRYKDYSINFGYSYNWVFAKNCLANISMTPAIGYKNTSFRLENGKEFIKNINFDLISRAAIVYNNSKFFIGASVISHTYSYRKSSLSIVNGFGTLNIYTGINLFRNKEK